jgi:hypothetical protein
MIVFKLFVGVAMGFLIVATVAWAVSILAILLIIARDVLEAVKTVWRRR